MASSRQRTAAQAIRRAIFVAGGVQPTEPDYRGHHSPSTAGLSPPLTANACTDGLAAQGMNQVPAEAAKCPATFSILGGPPVIVGNYTINSRPMQLGEWGGFAQQLVHTFPSGVDLGTYDDLVTIVVRKANAILYVGFEQTKQTGERADSATKVKDAMKVALGRLG
jgi:hypothetical protein